MPRYDRQVRTLAVALLAGCGRIGFAPAQSDGAIDTPIDAPVMFGQPRSVGAPNVGGAFDDDPSLSPDLLELYFASDRVGGLGQSDIWRSTRASAADEFGAATHVAELSSAATEGYPALSSNGLTIWIARGPSIVTATRPDLQSAWSTPVTESALDVVGAGEKPGGVFDSDLQIVFEVEYTGTNRDLFIARRAAIGQAWSAPQPIAELNSAVLDAAPATSGNGLAIYFYSDRGGNDDLWVARRPDLGAPFAPAEPIVEINTLMLERDPYVTADESTIVFTRGGDMYTASR